MNAQRAKQTYKYKNNEEKLYKCNGAIWYNKSYRHHQVTPSYIAIKINGDNAQCRKVDVIRMKFNEVHLVGSIIQFIIQYKVYTNNFIY
jgi:hypothetical protein